jgi:hypothetical protein
MLQALFDAIPRFKPSWKCAYTSLWFIIEVTELRALRVFALSYRLNDKPTKILDRTLPII